MKINKLLLSCLIFANISQAMDKVTLVVAMQKATSPKNGERVQAPQTPKKDKKKSKGKQKDEGKVRSHIRAEIREYESSK